ncbi:DUF1294 domain-containing protein [Rivibacter subsaxonicus]|uniref:Uncharacterized membrane protein YsdA (DUF1294 family) n=1 Tax=Rivibacter subsaxonicus TaxID=457575 RepID=A0A4Q7W069_9BURK|nr:DUF1294 domain-containing protein [Rivibacter subsaxonicus]RZU02592.1 uncharacterized membrane protein YsdA (DUF1294 family) [Rivibacter subsaxonicus]
MRKHGRIVRWESERGFGFIRSDDAADAQEAFVHVRELRHGMRPEVGQRVVYDEIHLGGRGPRAVAVVAADIASAGQSPKRPPALHATASVAVARPPQRGTPRRPAAGPREPGATVLIGLPLIVVYAGVLLWAAASGRLPLMVPLLVLLLSGVTFFVYWQDKYAASQRRWRTREDTLHAFALFGGWPGAWLAQLLLRHKSRKASFLTAFWITVFVHCAALGALLWLAPDGSRWWH